MEKIEQTYLNIIGDDGLENHSPAYSRKWLKERIMGELPAINCVLQKGQGKSSVLYNPEACAEDHVNQAMDCSMSENDRMSTIFRAAKIVRQSIKEFKRKESDTIEVTSSVNDVPAEVYTMLRWIMIGPVEELETAKKTSAVDRVALTVSQNIMYGFKSDKQVKYKSAHDSSSFRTQTTRENPQSLGLALTIHHDTRNKTMIELLNAHGYCVTHKRTLRLETALANAVVENTKKFQGLYVPPMLKKNAFVFFAADNTDFAEDTADGKSTTHGTIVAVYQKAEASGEAIAPPLAIKDADSLSVEPYHVNIIETRKPKPQVIKRTDRFEVNKSGIERKYELLQKGWVFAFAVPDMREETTPNEVPCWAGYNSLLSKDQCLTEVGALPLLPEVAHEWSTLLTVIDQANKLRKLAVGNSHPTVISFDMALYEKVIQLIDSRPDLKISVVPRLGELHAVMAALRALGASIENSGIDDAWIEADVYGPATTRQILKCTHYKRSLHAHIYTYMALYELALEEFFSDNPQLQSGC